MKTEPVLFHRLTFTTFNCNRDRDTTQSVVGQVRRDATCTFGHDMRPKMDKIRLSFAPVNTNFWFNHKMWEIWHKKILTDLLSSTLTHYLYILLSHVFSQNRSLKWFNQIANLILSHHITVTQCNSLTSHHSVSSSSRTEHLSAKDSQKLSDCL